MSFVYLAMLTVSLGGLVAIDLRLKLALAIRPLQTIATLAFSVLFFLLWDAVGISLGVFFKGQSPLLTGVMLAPELPLEEPIFLTLLCYSTLLLFLGVGRKVSA